MRKRRKATVKLSRVDKELIELKEKVKTLIIKDSQERLKVLLKDLKSTNLGAKLGSPSKTYHSSSVQS